MAKKISNKEFLERVEKEYNGEYIPLTEYTGTNKKMKFKHLKCGREFEINLHSISKISCKYCNTRKYTHESIQKLLNDKTNHEYLILDKFETMHKNVNIKHLKCGKVFSTDMHHMINNGTRCPYCYAKNLKKNTEIFKKEVYDLVKDNYTVLSEYKSTHTPIKIRHNCEKCNNHEFEVQPCDFLSHGNRCPICRSSKGEQKIAKYLTENNINFIHQKVFDDCINKVPLKFDFFLPDFNIAIEFDGIQHFEAIEYFGGDKQLKIIQKRDGIKNNFCNENKIELIRIPYFKFSDIENIINKKLISSTTIETK